MNNFRAFRLARLAVPLFILMTAAAMMAGCGSKSPQFYLLTPTAEIQPLRAAAPPAAVIVGPVALPEYLNRTQQIIREDGNRLVIVNGHRWAEPLAANINRVLIENLSRSLPEFEIRGISDRVSRDEAAQVTVTIFQFEGLSNGTAVLNAKWRTARLSGGGKQTTIEKSGSYEQPFDWRKRHTLATAMSGLLGQLSSDIAKSMAE